MSEAGSQPIKRTGQLRLTRFLPYLIVVVLLAVLPALIPSYVESIMTKVLIYAILAMSLDMIMGYTGLLSFGHAAYYGGAGYMTAILISKLGITSFWIVAPAGILMAGILAVIFGFISLRVSGIYFLLVTFALSMLLVSVATKFASITGGSDGLSNLPYPDLGFSFFTWNFTSYYYFVLIFFIICFFLMYRIVHSPFGKGLQGIRESESRMSSLGYNTWLYKYAIFIIGGLFAGVAGVLTTSHDGVIAPFHVGVTVSSLAMLICIIGGSGTLWGPVIGAAVIILVEYFSSLYIPARWPLVLGGMFILTVMFLRGGIALHLLNLWKKVSHGIHKN